MRVSVQAHPGMRREVRLALGGVGAGGLPGGPGAALRRLPPAASGPVALGRRARLLGSCQGPRLVRVLVGASWPGGTDWLRLPLQRTGPGISAPYPASIYDITILCEV